MTDTSTLDLPYSVERTVTIRAPRDTVFRYFTDSERWAAWWGAGSTIVPVPGGQVHIRYPNGIEAGGEVVEVAAPDHVVFTYGFRSGQPIALGASVVTIALRETANGTVVHLTHRFAEPAARDQHEQGWRYQLSLFANVVADEAHRGAAETIDAWFAAWSEAETVVRESTVRRIAAPTIAFHDKFSHVVGLTDLLPHLAAIHRFMPGMRLIREGVVRHCQGMALADWRAVMGEEERGRGTNVFVFDATGAVAAVTGFWG